jgi:hypothetical protein
MFLPNGLVVSLATTECDWMNLMVKGKEIQTVGSAIWKPLALFIIRNRK